MARRWKSGLPESADYFYDEEVKDVWKKPKDFPPDNLELSDAWVVTIVNSKLSREERGDAWPAVFTLRGALRAQYLHKGQPAKLYDPETKAIKYALLFGEHNMIGTEGMKEGLPAKRPTPLDDAEPVTTEGSGQSYCERWQLRRRHASDLPNFFQWVQDTIAHATL